MVQDVLATVDALGGRPLVQRGVGLQEREGVVPGQQGAPHHVAHAAVGETLFLGADQT